jgi:tartrate dehydrogenase/decarboxylase / D-malate dehydrogenase
MNKKHKIAVIAGDGIGKEVVPEGLRVLDAVSNDSD